MKKMLWAVLCLGLAVALGAMGWEGRRQAAAFAGWRPTSAKVERQRLEEVQAGHQPGPKSNHQRLTIHYSYEIDGRPHQGEDSISQSVEDWSPWVSPYAEGKVVEIRVNPSDPSQSRAFAPSAGVSGALLGAAGVLGLLGVGLLALRLVRGA